MKLTCFTPPDSISEFVELIWMIDGVNPNRRERVLPNGVVELIVNLGSWHKVVDETDPTRFEIYKAGWIAGIQERPITIEPCRETRLVGIRFRPGGARPLLRFPLRELTNRVIECDLIFGPWWNELRERILGSSTTREAIAVVEATLLARLSEPRDRRVGFAVDRIHQTWGRCPIDPLSNRLGISHKHLITRFLNAVGTTPKMLARIERFQQAISLAAQNRKVDWSVVAAHCGYYDQSHMIRDFRRLASVTPQQYLRSRDADYNHLVV